MHRVEIDIEDAGAAKTGLLGWKTARRYEIPLYNARWSTGADKNFFVARIRRRYNGSTVRTVRSGVLWSKSYERSVVAEILEVLVHLVPVTEQAARIFILFFSFMFILFSSTSTYYRINLVSDISFR